MRGIATVDVSLMHPDAGPGEAHPVGHACSLEFTSFGNLVFAGICSAFEDAATGVENLSVEIGAFDFELFGNAEVPCRGLMLGTPARDPVVHGDLIIHQKEAPLGGEVDSHPGIRGVGGSDESLILPGPGGAGIRAKFKMLVGARWVGVDLFSGLDDRLFGVRERFYGNIATTGKKQARSYGDKEAENVFRFHLQFAAH